MPDPHPEVTFGPCPQVDPADIPCSYVKTSCACWANQQGARAESQRIVTWLREYANPVEIAGTILPSSNVAQSIANMIEEGQHHV